MGSFFSDLLSFTNEVAVYDPERAMAATHR